MNREEAWRVVKTHPEKAVELLVQMSAAIEPLQKRCEALERKVAELSKNSSNSSKPPSSDITRPKSKNTGGPNGDADPKRKIGGQPGHPKGDHPLKPTEDVNYPWHYQYDHCPECGGEVTLVPDQPPRIQQQIEIVDVPMVLHEHRSYPVWCEKCQKVHWKPFPENIAKEGLFKAKLTALVAYMKHVLHASFSAIRKFIRDVLHEKVSRGYLRKIVEKVGDALEGPYEELLHRIPLEATLNVDETGHKENGEKFWTWVFRADLYVLFKIDKSRGSDVLIEVLGREFEGGLGCDYFSAYRKYMREFGVLVQFCLAHLIRDVKFLADLPDAETRAYGGKLLDGLRGLFKVIHERETMTADAFRNALEEAKGRILRVAIEEAPSRLGADDKEQKREAQAMANRFRKHGEAYFAFITTPGMSPTNNLAEQAVRFVVMDRHVTQGTRSVKGRTTCERIWTVIGTCALQGRSAFEFIFRAVQAYFHSEPAPSLLSDSG